MNILYTSQEQVQVYKFSLPVSIGVPLLAIFFQSFISAHLFWLAIFDLPLLVTIFFAVARRNPISGLATGGAIGILQDSLAHHPIGMCGIAKTVVGFVASSLGVKLDVENPGSRMIMAFTFYLMHQAIYLLIARGMAGEVVTFAWTRLLLGAFANALLSVPLFAILDRFKMRT
jgi:rod shape-determining protein MreD